MPAALLHVVGPFTNAPCFLHYVGDGLLDVPLRGGKSKMHDGRIRTLSGADPPIVFVYATTPPSAASRLEAITDVDLIRRFAPPVRLAVPEKPFGLTLFLRFFDRCGNCVLAFSATCSARPQFPVRGEGFWRAGDDVGPYVSTAKRAEATNPPTSDGLLHAGCHLPLCRGGLGGWVIASSPTTAFEQTTPHPSFGEP